MLHLDTLASSGKEAQTSVSLLVDDWEVPADILDQKVEGWMSSERSYYYYYYHSYYHRIRYHYHIHLPMVADVSTDWEAVASISVVDHGWHLCEVKFGARRRGQSEWEDGKRAKVA